MTQLMPFVPKTASPSAHAQATANLAEQLSFEKLLKPAQQAHILSGGQLVEKQLRRRLKDFGTFTAEAILSAMRDWLALDAKEYRLQVTEGVLTKNRNAPFVAWQVAYADPEGSEPMEMHTGRLPWALISGDDSQPPPGPMHPDYVQALMALGREVPPRTVTEQLMSTEHAQKLVLSYASTPAVILEGTRLGLKPGAALDRHVETEIKRRIGFRIGSVSGIIAPS